MEFRKSTLAAVAALALLPLATMANPPGHYRGGHGHGYSHGYGHDRGHHRGYGYRNDHRYGPSVSYSYRSGRGHTSYGYSSYAPPRHTYYDSRRSYDRYVDRYDDRYYDSRSSYDDRRYDDGPPRGTAGRTIVGGLLGGLIGSQFGSGRGRDAATVAGVLIGSAIANDNAHRDDYYRDRGGRYDDRYYTPRPRYRGTR